MKKLSDAQQKFLRSWFIHINRQTDKDIEKKAVLAYKISEIILDSIDFGTIKRNDRAVEDQGIALMYMPMDKLKETLKRLQGKLPSLPVNSFSNPDFLDEVVAERTKKNPKFKKMVSKKLLKTPIKKTMGRCSHCGHGFHYNGRCPDETMNGYSCRCESSELTSSDSGVLGMKP